MLKRRLRREISGYLRDQLIRPPLPPKRFVIFGPARCGSTLLVTLLDSREDVHCDGEILNRPFLFPLTEVRRRAARSGARVYGFKLLSWQLKTVQGFRNPRRFLERLHRSGFRILYLSRRNDLRRVLSNLRLRMGGSVHHRSGEGPLERRPLRYDTRTVLEALESSEAIHAFNREVLEAVPHLSLLYEEDLEDPSRQQETGDRVAAYLGLDPRPVRTSLLKLAPQDLSDQVENLDELVDALRHTRYRHYLA